MIDINKPLGCGGGGGSEVLPYVSHIDMCNLKGYGLGAVLVWKPVYTLPILV